MHRGIAAFLLLSTGCQPSVTLENEITLGEVDDSCMVDVYRPLAAPAWPIQAQGFDVPSFPYEIRGFSTTMVTDLPDAYGTIDCVGTTEFTFFAFVMDWTDIGDIQPVDGDYPPISAFNPLVQVDTVGTLAMMPDEGPLGERVSVVLEEPVLVQEHEGQLWVAVTAATDPVETGVAACPAGCNTTENDLWYQYDNSGGAAGSSSGGDLQITIAY